MSYLIWIWGGGYCEMHYFITIWKCYSRKLLSERPVPVIEHCFALFSRFPQCETEKNYTRRLFTVHNSECTQSVIVLSGDMCRVSEYNIIASGDQFFWFRVSPYSEIQYSVLSSKDILGTQSYLWFFVTEALTQNIPNNFFRNCNMRKKFRDMAIWFHYRPSMAICDSKEAAQSSAAVETR